MEYYPVLDDYGKDADIIGYAETREEAKAIAEYALREAGNDDEAIEQLKSEGVLTYNFRSGSERNKIYNNINENELKNGFFDNA